MKTEEATELSNKSSRVILSCRTESQLRVAIRYANLVYRHIPTEVGMITIMRYVGKTERSIGYVSCFLNMRNETVTVTDNRSKP